MKTDTRIPHSNDNQLEACTGTRRELLPLGGTHGGAPARSANLVSGRSGKEALPTHRTEPTDQATQPPITNRGAVITTPLQNQTLIDWVSFTIKRSDPREVLTCLNLDSSLFTDIPSGRYGYQQSLCLGNITLLYAGRDEMGCHVCMSGTGCRQYEGQFPESPWLPLFKRLLADKAHFTRLDIASDNIDGQLSLDRLGQALDNNEIRSRFKNTTTIRNRPIAANNAEQMRCGLTYNFGNRQSLVMIRFYDKAAKHELPGHWTRAELELKGDRAQQAVSKLVAGLPVGRLFSGIVNRYLAVVTVDDANISRCPLQPWWSEWLNALEQIKLSTAQAIKEVPELMQFIMRQYSPSFAIIHEYLGPDDFELYLQGLVTDGRLRLKSRHKQMLRVSRLDEQHDTAEAMEFDERAAIQEYEGELFRAEAEFETRLRLRPDWESRS